MFKRLIKMITAPTGASLRTAADAALVTASRVNGFDPINWGKTDRRGPPRPWPLDEQPVQERTSRHAPPGPWPTDEPLPEPVLVTLIGKVTRCRILRERGCDFVHLAICVEGSGAYCGKPIYLKSRQFESLLAIEGDLVTFSFSSDAELWAVGCGREFPLRSFSIDWAQRRTETLVDSRSDKRFDLSYYELSKP